MSSGEADAHYVTKGLAAEEVPHKFETKNYWMEKYFDLLEITEELSKRHEWVPGLGGPCICEPHKNFREWLSQNSTKFGS